MEHDDRGARVAAGGAVAAVVAAAWWRRRRYLRSARAGSGPGIRTDDGVLLHVEARGGTGEADDRPTVVLVHGFATSGREMDEQRSSLARRHRVVELDQRGHGRSGWRGARRVHMDRLGRDLATVIERRTRGPVVVVGHSMGGMALMALARLRPDLIGSVVVGAAFISTSAGGLARTVLPARAAHVVRRTGLGHALLFVAWLAAPVLDRLHPFRTPVAQRWLAGSAPLLGEQGRRPGLPRRMADVRARLPRADTLAFYPAMLDHRGTEALEVLARVPTLVVSGTADGTIPADHSRGIADRLGPRSRLVLVEGAGHMVNLTHAALVNDELHRLLDRVRGTAT